MVIGISMLKNRPEIGKFEIGQPTFARWDTSVEQKKPWQVLPSIFENDVCSLHPFNAWKSSTKKTQRPGVALALRCSGSGGRGWVGGWMVVALGVAGFNLWLDIHWIFDLQNHWHGDLGRSIPWHGDKRREGDPGWLKST